MKTPHQLNLGLNNTGSNKRNFRIWQAHLQIGSTKSQVTVK